MNLSIQLSHLDPSVIASPWYTNLPQETLSAISSLSVSSSLSLSSSELVEFNFILLKFKFSGLLWLGLASLLLEFA